MPHNLQTPHLSFYPLRFHLVARQPLWFPRSKAGNTLRGALGQSVSVHESDTHSRDISTLPKSYVIRAAHLDGKYLKGGELFWFDLHLFDQRLPAVLGTIEAIRGWQTSGLGAIRAKVELHAITGLLPNGAEQTLTLLSNGLLPEPLQLPLLSTSDDEHVKRLIVHFLTPTELKAGGEVTPLPSFLELVSRTEKRIRNLCTTFGSVPLEPLASDWFDQARQVKLIQHHMSHVSVRRRSSRTSQMHPISGFTGRIEYEGIIDRYVPLLQAAYWTGVGRQTTWGKGVTRINLTCNSYETPPLSNKNQVYN